MDWLYVYIVCVHAHYNKFAHKNQLASGLASEMMGANYDDGPHLERIDSTTQSMHEAMDRSS